MAAGNADATLYQALVESCADVFTLLDAKGRVRYTSGSVEKVLGYAPSERSGKSAFALIHEEDVPGVTSTFNKVAEAPGAAQAFVCRVKHKDGSWRVVEATFVNRLNDPVAGIVVNYRDVTERRALEAQMRQAQKMEAVGRLARGIAHDFNNVLAAIQGNADLIQLRLKKNDPNEPDLLEITKAAERGAALTRQLLVFSKPRLEAEPERLNVHDVVRGIDSMLQRLSGDIELRLHVTGKPTEVLIGPGHIEQIVMNLVLNAREAIEEGGAIDVFADRKEIKAADAGRFPDLARGTYARIAVKDNGKGIDPSMAAHLFEPFFSTKDPSTGPGLGLSIVYGIAKDAGGAVAFTTAAGRGTTFEVLLPLYVAPDL
jgi:PAS domain S-box-containing protein